MSVEDVMAKEKKAFGGKCVGLSLCKDLRNHMMT